MGASDAKGDLGMSSSMGEKLSNGVQMEIDDDLMGSIEIDDLNKEYLKTFCKKVAIPVEPGYDPSKRGEGDWRYASVRFGKVTLERPRVWAGESDGKESLNFLPRHARLQNMTYSSRMKAQVHFQLLCYKHLAC
ncbi:DNA-directed RNA polymerases IV and V subunit 2 [Vitis vinifera]|uniref:DNA-directed RNA polymerases IV and V subunit 2 n=1 Tax=Vitis vinifera TaxID=29760 RepID=A0A438KES8_VITVI|nr:DNA-directed RNA polymerases IV and V subunit 2 [Vitis vinifera]